VNGGRGEGGGRKFARASDLQQVPLHDRARARPRKREVPVASVFVRASVLHTTPGAFSRWRWDNPLTLLAGGHDSPPPTTQPPAARSPTAVAGFYRRAVSFRSAAARTRSVIAPPAASTTVAAAESHALLYAHAHTRCIRPRTHAHRLAAAAAAASWTAKTLSARDPPRPGLKRPPPEI